MNRASKSKRTHLAVLAKFLIGMGIIFFLAGCAFKFGSLPKTDALDTLIPRGSTGADVLRVVGEPEGYGVVEHRAGLPPLDIWFYRYTLATASKANVKILWVFMDGDVYHGHFWFSSISEAQVRR